MKSVDDWLSELFLERKLISGVLTSPNRAANVPLKKVEMKPTVVKGASLFQFGYFENAKVTHKNVDPTAAIAEINSLMHDRFRQCDLRSAVSNVRIRTGKSGEQIVSVSPVKSTTVDLTPRHDREKSRILPDGKPIDFLIRLGVMTSEGRVISAKYDKFKQINRFLEMAADVVDRLKPEGTLHVIDFGSGKSYLTFALYYYFTNLRGRAVSMVGLDLKSDVVKLCNGISRDLGYTDLTFAVGDIAGYQSEENIDMVVSLHACDTATDDALIQAVVWGASVILSVPCCQHELSNQIRSDENRPLLKHGILKERLAALVTDALRAEWLETMGYTVQVMEFIETAHTAKNLLIRAVRSSARGATKTSTADYEAFRDYWHANPSIGRQSNTALSEEISSMPAGTETPVNFSSRSKHA